jgi:hypothetical protein
VVALMMQMLDKKPADEPMSTVEEAPADYEAEYKEKDFEMKSRHPWVGSSLWDDFVRILIPATLVVTF